MPTSGRTGSVTVTVAVALAIAGGSARAEQIDVTLTTLLVARAEPLGSTRSVVNAYQLISLDASRIQPVPGWFEDLRLVVSGWGEITFGGTNAGAAADLDAAFVEAKLLRQRVTVRAGRQLVVGGAARALHMDGVDARLRIWRGLHLEAFGGVPVVPRFAVRRADGVGGARLFWRQSLDTELGVSFLQVTEQGRTARQDLGLDARWLPHRTFAITGYGLLALRELRVAEADLAASWQPHRAVELRADFRHTAPDLFIARSSIFSVFSDERRDEVGGAVYLAPISRLSLSGDYHAIVNGAGLGHRSGGKISTHLGRERQATLTAEVRILAQPTGGYQQVRLYLVDRLTPTITVTLDLDAYHLERALNGQTFSFTAAASGAWDFAAGWRLVLTGIADTTPFFERRLEVMVRLAYNHTVRVHQVNP